MSHMFGTMQNVLKMCNSLRPLASGGSVLFNVKVKFQQNILDKIKL